jgi:hypothetical protein
MIFEKTAAFSDLDRNKATQGKYESIACLPFALSIVSASEQRCSNNGSQN